MKKLLLLFFFLFLLTGCTPYIELNDLAIVDMIGIDMRGNQYYLYLTTIEPEKEENSTKNKHKTTTITGKSYGEIFLKAKKIENKTTYYGHLKLLLVNQKLLNEDLLSYFKEEFTQNSYLLFAVSNNLEALLKEYPSSNLINHFVMKEKEEKKNITTTTFQELYATHLDKEKDASLPLLSLKKNSIQVEGLKLFSKNYIYSEKEARINYLLNKKITSYHEHYDHYEIEFKKLNVNFSYQKKKMKVMITGDLSSSDARGKELKQIKKKITKKLEDDIKSFYQKTRKRKIDTTLLRNTVYLKERNRKKTNNIYQNNPLQVRVKLGVDQNEKI